MPRRSDQPTQENPARSSAAHISPPARWICALIFLATLLAYFPSLNGSLIWDDAAHVTRPELRSLAGLERIWFEIGATQQYYPLLHSAFWLEHHLWGDQVLGYHLLNVLLHATACCLFGQFLSRLKVPGAWFAALLFALHPLCVESVAWISEQKNTLSTVFVLAAALAYLQFDRERRGRWYAIASAWFLLALLTKTVTATLPATLLVIFWWQRARLDWRRDILPLIPWLAAGAISGLLTARVERDYIGAQGANFAIGFLERCLIAGRVFWFYLGKLLWPTDLIFNYPRWTVDAGQAWQWSFLLGALLLAALLLRRQPARGALAALLIFAGSLFPVLGFNNVYPFIFSFVADHFAYLAGLAFFALAAAGLSLISARLPRTANYAAATALLFVLGKLTWQQSKIYRDVFILYETTLERNPASWLAHNNLATALTDSGRIEEATPHLEAAIKLRPNGFPEAESNLGDNLTRLRRPREAIPHLLEALRLQPTNAEAHNNFGMALIANGRTNEAIPHFEAAIRLGPPSAAVENNLGIALGMAGRTGEAIRHFSRATQIKPEFADAELNWGLGLILLERFAEALPHFDKAVTLEPASIGHHLSYAHALVRIGRFKEAVAQYESALRLKPADADTQMNLALALRQLGQKAESDRHYLEAIRLKPELLSDH